MCNLLKRNKEGLSTHAFDKYISKCLLISLTILLVNNEREGDTGVFMSYLNPGERLNDSDEILLQQVVVQLGQVGADDRVVPQLGFVLC